MGLEEVCRGFDIATSTGYEWIRTWNREGYAGLQEAPRTGCPPRLDEWDLAYLRVCLEERPYWMTREVKALIQEEFGVEYSDDQVVKILRQRLRMHFGKPFPRDYRRPPDAEQRLEADLKAVFERLQHEGYAAQEVALGCIDESSPQNTANTVRVWSFEGKPRAVQCCWVPPT